MGWRKMSLIKFAIAISYFSLVFYHTANEFSVKAKISLLHCN